MKTRASGLLAALALVALSVTTVQAQPSASATATATINIPTVLGIDVSDTNIAFDDPTVTDFEAGFIASTDQSVIDTKGNVAHDLTVEADASNFSGGSGSKPASDLVWSTGGAITVPGDGTGLSTSPATITSGLGRGVNASAATVDYGILLDFGTDAPDSYTLSFTYTLVPSSTP
jgi:hypothetical protein